MIKEALILLRQNHYKVTKQRRALLTYLSQFEQQYVDVTVVDEYMHRLFPGMSHNTIYRNIKEFSELGIIETQTRVHGMCVKYQCDFQHTHHHHFICRRCGRVIEVEVCPADLVGDQLPGCQLEDHHFEVYGLCAQCVHQTDKS
ncbi:MULTISPECIES: Fur family transcriptional regulator [unclassified Ligilactobacillus]|uniref:Fur family transcriptional regulator n=1 Tax=unclassified Ligilactobacillus TaxID=2767920 RepID=UPI0038523543